MAFPSTLFPLLSINEAVSDEEYRLFHTIDIKLIKTFIRRLGLNRLDALNVVAFLLWLERRRLCVNAVYKLVNLYWPDYMVEMLAHQVVAVLRLLENPMVMPGDIALIEELCDREIGFAELHRRRLEILDARTKIMQEMCERAFEDVFGRQVTGNDNGVRFAAGPAAYDPPQVKNNYDNGVGRFAAGPATYDPSQVKNNYHNGVGRFAAGPAAYDPPQVKNNHDNGVDRFVAGPAAYDPSQVKNNYYNGVGRFAAGPAAYDPYHNGVGRFAAGPAAYDPSQVKNNYHNGVGRFVAGPAAYDPPQVKNNYHSGVDRFAAGPTTSDPRPLIENNYHNGVGRFAAGHATSDPRPLIQNYHNGLCRFAAGPATSDPRPLIQNKYHNGVRFADDFGEYASGPVNPQQVWHYHGGHVHQFGVVGSIPRNGVKFGSDNYGQDMRQLRKDPLLSDVAVGPRGERVVRKSQGSSSSSNGAGTSAQKEILRDPIPEHEVARLLRGLNITEEDINVHQDDRTVFLTFSRGYPVTELEVRNFFTRRFGHFIKALYLEQVLPGVQPLYARMVAQNPSILPLICDVEDEEIRIKYIINGKHVWAKKYERRD